MRRSAFEKDFAVLSDKFPKLKCSFNKKNNQWIVIGEIDISDIKGNYWDTFRIRIFMPDNYPFGIPILQELSNVIRRTEEWHIDKYGICCTDINHNLQIKARRGIRIYNFIEDEVYPYLANQLFKCVEKKYAGSEYDHGFEGIIQYYKRQLDLQPELALLFLKMVSSGNLPNRNDPCPCNSGRKLKSCHLNSINSLKDIQKSQVQKDIDCFQNYLSRPSVGP